MTFYNWLWQTQIYIQNDHLGTSQEAINALRKIFKYFLQKQLFTVQYGKEWGQRYKEITNKIEDFLNKKWSVFVQLLFQKIQENNLNQILSLLHYSSQNYLELENSPVFLKLVETIINHENEQLQQQMCENFIKRYADLASVFFRLAQMVPYSKPIHVINFLKHLQFDDENCELMFSNQDNKEDHEEKKTQKKIKISKDCYKPIQKKDVLSIEEQNLLRQQNYSSFVMRLIETIKSDDALILEFFKIVNKFVVDKFENPLLISNFVQHHFDQSNNLQVKILALQSLFILIGKFQYNYNNFYQQLESLISHPEIFENPETSRYLKLLFIACKSSKVPEQQLHSIIKKLLKQSLCVKPNRQLWIVSFVFNILKKTQSMRKYLQRKEVTETEDDSYFWELVTLKEHWLAEIKDVVNLIGDDPNELDAIDLDVVADLTDDQLLQMHLQKFSKD